MEGSGKTSLGVCLLLLALPMECFSFFGFNEDYVEKLLGTWETRHLLHLEAALMID